MRRLVPCPSCTRHIFVDDTETENEVATRACPHCGTREVGGIALWVVAASMGLAACSPAPVAVYGPAPDPSDGRMTAPTASTPAEPQQPVAVYGPPPSNPDQRLPDAGPTPSASVPQPPTTSPTAPRSDPPKPIYGPAPRRPDQRSNDPSSKP